jgi:hypothetical protein
MAGVFCSFCCLDHEERYWDVILAFHVDTEFGASRSYGKNFDCPSNVADCNFEFLVPRSLWVLCY